MLKTKLIAIAAFAAFIISPSLVSAEEASPKVSYSAKKQGRVAFQKQDEAAAAQESATDEVNPADIEPAAGGSEPENVRQDDVAKSIKLPRKN